MAIIAIDPSNWKEFNVVQIDSDANENKQAIAEIEEWAAQNGFARTTEYWLRPIIKSDDRRVFRGICYRLTHEVMRTNEEASRQLAEAVDREPMTVHHVDADR